MRPQAASSVANPLLGVLVTIDETADYLGVTPDAVRRAITRGELKAVQLGGSIRLRRQSIQQLAGAEVEETQWPQGAATPEDAGAVLRLNPETVRRFVADGILPGYRIGRTTRIRWSHLRELIQADSIPPGSSDVADGNLREEFGTSRHASPDTGRHDDVA